MKTNSDKRRIRITIVSIDDKLYLPSVYQPLFIDPSLEIAAVFLIPTMSAINMHPGGSLGLAALYKRCKLYGISAFLKLFILHINASIYPNKTINGMASSRGIPIIYWRGSINDDNFIHMIRKFEPDLLIGVFSEKANQELIASTSKGIMLLHYSLLPQFAGREPTFWTLLEKPENGGITFFKATDKLDAGAIIIQASQSLTGIKSLHDAIVILSEAAGQNIVSAVNCLYRGMEIQSQAIEKKILLKTWPRQQDRMKFIQKGLRFI